MVTSVHDNAMWIAVVVGKKMDKFQIRHKIIGYYDNTCTVWFCTNMFGMSIWKYVNILLLIIIDSPHDTIRKVGEVNIILFEKIMSILTSRHMYRRHQYVPDLDEQ